MVRGGAKVRWKIHAFVLADRSELRVLSVCDSGLLYVYMLLRSSVSAARRTPRHVPTAPGSPPVVEPRSPRS